MTDNDSMTDPAPKPTPSKDASPGWGADELTKFFDVARENQWATFWNKRSAVEKLIAIDAEFVKVSKDWQNPHSEIAASLLLRCHAAFRTAAGLAMSGQAAEAFILCRAMLEGAAYAVHIHRHPDLARVWLDRHEDSTSMKTQKDTFLHRKVLESVTAVNVHAGERFEKLYQLTIDFGGHPNERSVTGNMKIVDEPGKRTMLTIMQHGDGIELDHALKSVARCGMTSLEMLQAVFPARFELLGISAAMLELRKGLRGGRGRHPRNPLGTKIRHFLGEPGYDHRKTVSTTVRLPVASLSGDEHHFEGCPRSRVKRTVLTRP